MPLRSMTGFGQADKATPSGTYRIEIRGVNNRYLEIQFRTPRSFANLEQRAKQLLGESISRGSHSVNISWDDEGKGMKLTWDKGKVSAYMKIFKEIIKSHKLEGGITLGNLLTFSDFIKAEAVEHDDETVWRHVKPVLEKAIAQFQRSREAEAAVIVRQLQAMNSKITVSLEQIEQLAPARVKVYAATLAKKVEALGATVVDPQRLAAEVALMSDRLDISEECTRLKAHIDKFSKDLDASDPAGKRMTFVLQEMNREANTIGSKANDAEISHLAVAIKEVIEQMREQAQNME